jgi:DNA-binding CsgD family transcriptional regulator
MARAREATLGDPLSQSELKALTLASRGLDNQQIADELWLSIHTIKTQMCMSYVKLGANNRTHAVVIALSHGLIPMPTFVAGGVS